MQTKEYFIGHHFGIRCICLAHCLLIERSFEPDNLNFFKINFHDV